MAFAAEDVPPARVAADVIEDTLLPAKEQVAAASGGALERLLLRSASPTPGEPIEVEHDDSPRSSVDTPSVVEPAKLSGAASALLVLVCACLISSTGLLTRAAEVDGQVLYSPFAASLFSELGKLAIGVVWAMAERTPFPPPAELGRAALAFVPPALGYVVVNNLRFTLVQVINPGLLQLLWNLKIVFIGALYALPPFHRRLELHQWGGAAILVAGTCAAEASQWEVSDSDGNSMTGDAWGMALVAVSLTLTSASAVACEHAYKSTDLSLPRQNIVLYSYGAGLNLLAATALREEVSLADLSLSSLTQHFSGWTWAVVAAQSLAGFSVGAVFKYVDSVAQVFADVCAMIVAAAVSHFLFGLALNRLFLVAMLTCAAALCVYYADKLPPNTPCVARLLRRARPLRGHSPAIVEMLRSAPAKNELVREQGIGDGEESRPGGEERVGLAGERCESAQY